MSFTEQQQVFEKNTDRNSKADNAKADIKDIENFLRNHQNYLELPVEESYKLTQKHLGTLGGRMVFRSVIRKLKGDSITSLESDVKIAVETIKELGLEFIGTGAPHAVEEEEALQGLQVFIDAIREFSPKAVFTSTDVCRWALSYFAKKEIPLPTMLNSPNKLSFVLKNNSDILGLTADGKGYIVNTIS